MTIDESTRAVGRAPGPDPNVCDACGGPMSLARRGRHTGLWWRTCRNLLCLESTATAEMPADCLPRGPIAGPPSTSVLPFDRFVPPAIGALDVKQRAAGRDPGEEG